MLTKQQSALLARMRADNAASGFPFVPLGWWEKVGEQFEGWFDECGIGDVTTQDYDMHFAGLGGQSALARYIEKLGGSLDGYEELRRYVTGLLRLAIRTRYGVQVPRLLNVSMDWGSLISYESLLAIAEVDRAILDDPVTVADLGAGWGRIGYTLMKLNPHTTYIIYDIPDSLIISHTYLNKMYPDLCHPYGEKPNGDPGIYFLGSQELASAEPADFLITIATTQEMEPDHAAAYLDIIENKTRWFYTLQRKKTGLHYKDSWRRHFYRSPLWADYHFEAMFEFSGDRND